MTLDQKFSIQLQKCISLTFKILEKLMYIFLNFETQLSGQVLIDVNAESIADQ
jgi:hypothetical protein